MRDPYRIYRILEQLQILWEKNPDMRLGQLLQNFGGWLPNDYYYFEDDDLEKELYKNALPLMEERDEWIKSESHRIFNKLQRETDDGV